CTRSTPASIAARQLIRPIPRSRCPCQSTLTSFPFTMSSLTNFTNALTPSGVAWPTVSAMQIRPAPQSIAVRYSALSVSGRPRARQAQVGGRDAEVCHEVQQAPLDLEGGVPYRGRLQAVAEGLVVQVHSGPRPVKGTRRPVPVIDQLTLVHWTSVACRRAGVKRPSP